MAAARYAVEHVLPGGTERVGSVPEVEQHSDDAPVTHGHSEHPAHAEGGGRETTPTPSLYEPLGTRKKSKSEAASTAGRKPE